LARETSAQFADTLPDFLSPRDLQRIIGCSRATSYLIAAQLGAVRFGGTKKLVRVPKARLLAYIEDQLATTGKRPAA
jgi:hypothetical protein